MKAVTDHLPDDISPAGHDARALTDELRRKHPLVHNTRDEWVLLRHTDVVAAALDDATFSSAVSAHLQIPNGLDGVEHDRFRAALDPFLTPEAIAPAEVAFAAVAARLASELPRGVAVDAVTEIGAVFAVRAQSAWLGWPAELEGPLVAWVDENHEASRAGDRERLAAVASDFDALIESVLAPRRGPEGTVIGDDLTAELMRVRVDGRPLRGEEIVSVLRNWTGGDLGSIALCVGVLVHGLADHLALQERLRAGVPDAELDAVIDELLRIDDPFVSNRRVTTRPVSVASVELPAGAKVKLHWTSANRDEAVFGDPDGFDPDAHAADNLVYGVGRHVCPGRTLATVELRIAVRALLEATSWIGHADGLAAREVHPVGGWAAVPVVLR